MAISREPRVPMKLPDRSTAPSDLISLKTGLKKLRRKANWQQMQPARTKLK